MIVVDASAVIEVLLVGPKSGPILKRFRSEAMLHAPAILDLEVAQVLRRFEARAELTRIRAEQAMSDFRSLRLRKYPLEPLLERVWTLRFNLTAYDAAYVAVAEGLDAPLVTLDGRIRRASGHRAEVIVVD